MYKTYLLTFKKRQKLFYYFSLLLIFGFSFFTSTFAQSKIDLLCLAKGDSVILIAGLPPRTDEGINFYRKSGGQFVLLNSAGPVAQISNHNEIINVFGSKWADVKSKLSVNDPGDIIFRINEDKTAFIIMSLQFPEIFKIAGTWFVDAGREISAEAEYKLEYFDLKTKTINKTITKKIPVSKPQLIIPSSVTAEPKKTNITIKWSYPDFKKDFSDLAIQFYLYRKSGNDDYKRINDAVVLRKDGEPTFYTDEDVSNGTEYSYFVTAVDIIGNESNPSQTVKSFWKDLTPPEVPDKLKADSINGAIGISWNMNLELDAKGYNVYRGINTDKDLAKLNILPLPVDVTYFYDKSFDYGVQYFYRITCIDTNQNESEKSNAIAVVYEDTNPPEAPADFNYTFENKIIKAKWTPSGSSDVMGYFFYRGESKNALVRVNHNPISELFLNDSGIEGKGFVPGKKYTIAVTAYDKARNESQKVLIEDILIPDNEPPLPPTGLIATNLDANYIQITCGGSTSPDVSSYKLFRIENSTTAKPQEIASFIQVPFYYLDTNVQKLQTYFYYAQAFDFAGNESLKSNVDTVKLIDYVAPPSPKYAAAEKIENGVKVFWEEVQDFDLLGYNIYKSNLPNGVYKKINSAVVKDLIFVDPNGRINDCYVVKALDTSGNESIQSNFASPQQ